MDIEERPPVPVALRPGSEFSHAREVCPLPQQGGIEQALGRGHGHTPVINPVTRQRSLMRVAEGRPTSVISYLNRERCRYSMTFSFWFRQIGRSGLGFSGLKNSHRINILLE